MQTNTPYIKFDIGNKRDIAFLFFFLTQVFHLDYLENQSHRSPAGEPMKARANISNQRPQRKRIPSLDYQANCIENLFSPKYRNSEMMDPTTEDSYLQHNIIDINHLQLPSLHHPCGGTS